MARVRAGRRGIGHLKAGIVSPGDDLTVLYGLGAQKAGTTWLFSYFRAHPQVHVPPVKELHYFDVLFADRPSSNLKFRRARRDRLQGSILARTRDRLNGVRAGLKGQVPPPRLRFLRQLLEMNETPDPEHRSYWAALLSGYRGQPVAVDISPGYDMLTAEQFRQMAGMTANTRFLYILRDPVDRAMSNLRMFYQVHLKPSGMRDAYRRAAWPHS